MAAITTATGASAQQTLLGKALDRFPSLLGAPRQPSVALPPTPALAGVTRAAATAIAGDVKTFDLGGFRLGMSEPEVEAVAKSRGYTVGRVLRFVDFETQVRAAINAHGGAGGQSTRRGVLGEASLTDRNGGKYELKMLVWPDGSHLDQVTYIAPRGTGAEDWRRLLIGKWGKSDSETTGQSFVARWRGREAAGPGAAAEVGSQGGTVSLFSAEGSRGRPAALVDQAVDAFFAASAGKPSL